MNKFILFGLAAIALQGCVIPHPYTSNEYQKYKQSDLKVPERPYVIKLETEFARNGQTIPAVNPLLAKAVNQALNDTKVAVSAPQAENSLKVYGNNIANIAGAAGSGFKTGLTLGLAGSKVQDYYKFYCSYSDGKTELSRTEFDHAIVSTIGVTSTPVGLTPHANLNQAFDSVTKDIVINCLGDLQHKGYLLPQ